MSDVGLAVIGTGALVTLGLIASKLRWPAVIILAILAVYCAGALAYRNYLFQEDFKKNIKELVQPTKSAETFDEGRTREIKASFLELVGRASSLSSKIETRRTDVLLHIATASRPNAVLYFPSDIIECEFIRGSGLALRNKVLRLKPNAVDPDSAVFFTASDCMSSLSKVVADMARMAQSL